MVFEAHTIPIESYAGVTIQNALRGYGGQRLLVILPGVGYRVQSPLLHFLSRVAWQNGDDVLAVEYGFQIAQTGYAIENQANITGESQEAITKALARGYDDVLMIGKSLGTPMAALFANHFEQTSKCLLLTPVQNAHKMVEHTPTLAVIGTADSRYTDGLAVDTELVRWKVYDGLNHSLEVDGDVNASLAIFPDIIQTCSNFLYG